MLLLFVPEFAPQQFAGFVGNLPQPLFKRLFLFAINLPFGGPASGAGRTVGVATRTGSLLVGSILLSLRRAVFIRVARC